MFMGR